MKGSLAWVFVGTIFLKTFRKCLLSFYCVPGTEWSMRDAGNEIGLSVPWRMCPGRGMPAWWGCSLSGTHGLTSPTSGEQRISQEKILSHHRLLTPAQMWMCVSACWLVGTEGPGPWAHCLESTDMGRRMVDGLCQCQASAVSPRPWVTKSDLRGWLW